MYPGSSYQLSNDFQKGGWVGRFDQELILPILKFFFYVADKMYG